MRTQQQVTGVFGRGGISPTATAALALSLLRLDYKPIRDRRIEWALQQLGQPAVEEDVPPVHVLQEWEGYVVKVEDDCFTARLLDITREAKYDDEQAVIPFDAILPEDHKRVEVDAVFRWIVGFRFLADGEEKVSRFVFRDFPTITEADLAKGRRWADKVLGEMSGP